MSPVAPCIAVISGPTRCRIPTPFVTKMSKAAAEVDAASNSAHQPCHGSSSVISTGPVGGTGHRSKSPMAAPIDSSSRAALVPNV